MIKNNIFTRLYVVLVFLLSIMHNIYGQKIIQMENDGGVYKIPCKVNGAKMKMVFDTGASHVSLSEAMAEYLFDNDYLSDKDIIGESFSVIADGTKVKNLNIKIKDLEIDGLHINNVEASVIRGQNAPLLLGLSAIQKLGSIQISGNVLKIMSGGSDYDTMVDKLIEEAKRDYDNRLYARAEEKYSRLYSMGELSEFGIYRYASSCFLNKNCQKTYEIINEIKDFDYYEKKNLDIYKLMGNACFGLKNFDEAATYYDLSGRKMENSKEECFILFYNIGDCYYFNNNYSKASDFYNIALSTYAKIKNVDVAYIRRDSKNKLKKKEPSFRSDEIDYVLFQLVFCYLLNGDWDTEGFLFEITAMARANNKYATRECNKKGIDPYSSAWR